MVPLGTDNVTVCRTIYSRHAVLTAPTVRHELTHVSQYARVGTLAFLIRYLTSGTFRRAAETEAHQAETADYPQWTPCA